MRLLDLLIPSQSTQAYALSRVYLLRQRFLFVSSA